jgi:hypothetical protein
MYNETIIKKTPFYLRLTCLLVRLGLAYYSIYNSKLISYFYTIVLINYILGNPWLGNSQNKKGFFGNPLWWNKISFYHNILYVLFLISVYFNYNKSHYFLFLDCLIAFYVLFQCYALLC